MGTFIRFYSTIIWIAITLGLAGQLKSCTLTMMGLAARNTELGMMSYSHFTRQLWGRSENPAAPPRTPRDTKSRGNY